MDEKEYKKCLKIHGNASSEEDSGSESKLDLDGIYEAFKPPPISIDPKIHNIIEIGGTEKNKRKNDDEILSKSQKKRRRKKLLEQHKRTQFESKMNGQITAVAEECNNSSMTDEEGQVAASLGLRTGLVTKEKTEEEPQKGSRPNFERENSVSEASNIESDEDKRIHEPERAKEESQATTIQEERFWVDVSYCVNSSMTSEEIYDTSLLDLKIELTNHVKDVEETQKEQLSSVTHPISVTRNIKISEDSNDGVQGAKKKRRHRRKRGKKKSPTTQEERCILSNPKTHLKGENAAAFLHIPEWNDTEFLTLFNDLMAFIEGHPKDALGIFKNVQRHLDKIQNFGITLTKGTYCITTLIKKIALRYRRFLKESKEGNIDLTVNEFIYDLNTIIMQTVLAESDLFQPMNRNENLIFDCFGLVLKIFSERIDMTVEDMFGYRCHNPFSLVRPKMGLYSSKMLPFINLAKSIQQSRLDSGGTEDTEITTNRQQDTDFSFSHGRRKWAKVCDTDNNTRPIFQSKPSQSELHLLVIEDLTKNGRFYYDESNSGANFQSWKNLYFNEKIPESESNFQNLSEAHLQTLVLPDLTNNRFFYEDNYSAESFQSWQSFPNFHFNEIIPNSGSKLQESSHAYSNSDFKIDGAKAETGSFCVSGENVNVIEYPMLWILQFCEIKTLVGAVIFILVLKKALLWFPFAVLNFVDVFGLILLLLYVCTYFVIKF